MHPTQLKHRAVIHYNEFTPSLRHVAKKYNIGKSTLARWLKQDVTERRNAKRVRNGMHDKIAQCIQLQVAKNPFQTASELVREVRESTNAIVSRSTVYKSLHRLGHTYKLSQHWRDIAKVPRDHPFMQGGAYSEHAISLDESSFYWNDFPTRAWGPRGHRIAKGRPESRMRVNLVLAIGREGIIRYSIFKGKNTASVFANFLSGLPDGRPVILDNSPIHKTIAVRNVASEKRIDLRFTPPYCPWYNPVEFCFSEIKAMYRPLRLRRSPDFVRDVESCVLRARHFATYFNHAEQKWADDKAQIELE